MTRRQTKFQDITVLRTRSFLPYKFSEHSWLLIKKKEKKELNGQWPWMNNGITITWSKSTPSHERSCFRCFNFQTRFFNADHLLLSLNPFVGLPAGLNHPLFNQKSSAWVTGYVADLELIINHFDKWINTRLKPMTPFESGIVVGRVVCFGETSLSVCLSVWHRICIF